MNIGLVIYPGCMTSGLFAFNELLSAANEVAATKVFNLIWVSTEKGLQHITVANSSLELVVEVHTLIIDKSLDALFIPGFWSDSALNVERKLNDYQELTQAIKKLPPEKPIFAYCTAVALLAESGRLKAKQATSTWWLAKLLHNKYPNIAWRFNQPHIDNQQTITAAGVNGYFQIAQTLIEKYCNQDIWRTLVSIFVIPRPVKTIQPFDNLNLMQINDPEIRKIYLWVMKTQARLISLDNLAKEMLTSKRTISRQVKKATGLPCIHFLRMIKLSQVGEQLIYTENSIATITHQLGYSDDAALRRSFKKESQYTPTEFRKIFKR
jgi:transcriptional regulator GlxA family with amidase domain